MFFKIIQNEYHRKNEEFPHQVEGKCHTCKSSLKAEERMKYFCNFECGIILHEKANVQPFISLVLNTH